MIMVDKMEGSYLLALHEPIRSMLDKCGKCNGEIATRNTTLCKHCRGTGRFLSNLSSGDVCFTGNGPNGPLFIGIELKSISDMVQSLSHGRLQEQIRKMIQQYDISWILQYGRCRPGSKSYPRCPIPLQVYKEKSLTRRREGWYDLKLGTKPVPYGYLESFKVSPSLLSLNVIHSTRVETLQEAAHWIGVLYRTWSKPYHQHSSMRTFDQSGDKIKNNPLKTITDFNSDSQDILEMAKFVAGLPGVRYERAIAISRHFRSIEKLMFADVSELANVVVESQGGRSRRLGPVIAKSLIEFITKKRK